MEIFIAFPSRRRLLASFRPALFALAALVTGLGGLRAQQPSNAPPITSQPDSKMQNFVILFRQGPRTLTESDKLRRSEEVSAWARVQNAAGHKLEPRILGAEVLRPGGDATGGTGATTDTYLVTALLFLQAGDLAEAASVAGTHPGIHFGASVEVRPWAPPAIPAAPKLRAASGN
jgi:hypothetical protein